MSVAVYRTSRAVNRADVYDPMPGVKLEHECLNYFVGNIVVNVRFVHVIGDGWRQCLVHAGDAGFAVVSHRGNVSREFGPYIPCVEKWKISVPPYFNSDDHAVISNVLTIVGVQRLTRSRRAFRFPEYQRWLIEEILPHMQSNTKN